MEPDPTTSTAAPATAPQASTPPASVEDGLLLAYATPWPRRKYVPSPQASQVFWLGVRKVVFAGGLGLMTWGLASLYAGGDRHTAPAAVGWGLFFVILMLPLDLRRLSRGRPKPRRTRLRHRRRRARARAAFPADSGIDDPCGSSASTPACDSPATASSTTAPSAPSSLTAASSA